MHFSEGISLLSWVVLLSFLSSVLWRSGRWWKYWCAATTKKTFGQSWRSSIPRSELTYIPKGQVMCWQYSSTRYVSVSRHSWDFNIYCPWILMKKSRRCLARRSFSREHSTMKDNFSWLGVYTWSTKIPSKKRNTKSDFIHQNQQIIISILNAGICMVTFDMSKGPGWTKENTRNSWWEMLF